MEASWRPEQIEGVLARVPERWRSVWSDEPSNLVDDLQKIFFLKSNAAHPSVAHVEGSRSEGWSTYALSVPGEQGGLQEIGRVQFAPLFNGNFLIRKTHFFTKQVISWTEHYSETGIYLGRYLDMSPNLLYVNTTEMDPNCPIVSHIYNVLLYEYQQAETGMARSNRIRVMDAAIRKCDTRTDVKLSYRSKPLDEALVQMNRKLRENEVDRALTFADKKALRVSLKAERWSIVRVKSRVHGMNRVSTWHKLRREDVRCRLYGIRNHPVEKASGILHQYTIGLILWFFSVVRSNIGYSVALAIYAPFTFYFITQPMNPGAMWAVGQVRSAYLTTTETIASLPVINLFTGKHGPNYDEANAPKAETKDPNAAAGGGSNTPPFDPSTRYASVKPKMEGFLTMLDVPKVENQSWSDRMSSFKQMQISYESNLQFSQRMGRLEQMENQLNFPLIAENAYWEVETYLGRLRAVREVATAKGVIAGEVDLYLKNETVRSKQFKLYIWDKMVRYMLDHPYVVLNEAKEQMYVDYYIGRNFIFLEEITNDLMKEYEGMRKPKGFKAIEELSKFYRSKKIEAPTVEGRLQANSYLANQKEFYDTNEMRAKLKRQWEILFLSYNRTQEASNFGLQLYFWSVRNAVWTLGALTTMKNREMEVILTSLEHPNDRNKLKASLTVEKSRIEPMYESLFHIFSLEYVSIREELNTKLDKDIDSTQRQALIESIRGSFEERTRFLKAVGMN